MAFLFILFLNINFAYADEIINNINTKDSSFGQVNKVDKKDLDNILSNEISLKNIPRTKVSEKEKKTLKDRNPFLPSGINDLESKSGINFKNISFKGIAKIGERKVAFIETSEGTNGYEIGQRIGGGFTISKIDEKSLEIEITNQSIIHKLKLKKDEK